jgi:hypothetical protein
MEGGANMETYEFYPPQVNSTTVAYQLLADGVRECRHELLDEDWCDRILVQDGIVFVTYSCRHCGRQVTQSLDEVSPPGSWMGVRS